jgi:hypothetical protein
VDSQLQHRLFLATYVIVCVYVVIMSLGNLGVAIVNVSLAVLGAICFAVLNKFTSDESYYRPLNLYGLAVSVGAIVGMIGVAGVFGYLVNLDALSLFTTSNSIFPLSNFSKCFDLPAFSGFPALA